MEAYPSEASQLKALEIIARKTRPDLTATTTELTGKDGAALIPAAPPEDRLETARRMAFVLASVAADNPEASKRIRDDLETLNAATGPSVWNHTADDLAVAYGSQAVDAMIDAGARPLRLT